MQIDDQNEVVEVKQKSTKDEKQVSFEIGYIIPFWSSKPLHKYSLDVWRDGLITDSIEINNKEYYLFGRNKDVCDIYIGNMTVSRVHCVLQHKDDGEVFLYDLESVYGTFINKRPITKKTYVKLNVGDTFRLGKTGRMFILNGPSELMPDEDTKPIQITDRKSLMEKRINQLTEIYNKSEEYKRSLLGQNKDFSDWGQKDFEDEIRKHEKMVNDEDENEKEGIENEYLGPLNLEKLKLRKDLSEKQLKMITKMENIQTGINRLKEENLRIKKKESDRGEITEGQSKRLSTNEQKLKELYEKFELMEDNLRLSLSSKDGLNVAEVKFNKGLAKEIVSDDDEFYDRAKMKEQNNERLDGSQVVGNYETLKKSLEELIRTRQKMIDKLQKVDFEDMKEEKDKVDTLDQFMNENFSNIVSSQKERLANEIANLSKEITKTQKLISFVTPSFIKIKFKDDRNKPIVAPVAPITKEKTEFVDNDEDVEQEHNFKSLMRDSEAIKNQESQAKKKKKESNLLDTLNKFEKMKKKYQGQAFKKFTDSDEEILGEAENLRNRIDEEIAGELSERKKVVLKEIEKLKAYQEKMAEKAKQEASEEQGGLIIKKKKEDKKTYFDEIINNIGKTEFDLNNYSNLNNIMNKKQEDRNKKKIEKNIDYTVGGLQTFISEGLAELEEQKRREVKYIDDDLDFKEDDDLTKKKRVRYNDAQASAAPRKVFGATPKPTSRNQYDDDEEYDYDAEFIPEERFQKGHDLNGNDRKYKRFEEDY